MDIRALRYFQTVAECGSYSRGSELLRISQPAVSRTIRMLEDELGRPVFRRHGHGVTLTDAGRVLLERSQLLLRQLEQTKAEIRNTERGPSGIVTFAITPGAGHFMAPALVAEFGRAFPNVFLKIVGGFSGHIHEWLVRGQVDLACVHDPLPQRGFEVTPLIDEEAYLVGKPGSFPKKGEVRAEDLAEMPLIMPSRPNASRRLVDNWIAPHGIWLNAKYEVDDHTITRSLVKQGLGFSLLTRGAIEADLLWGEVEARALKPRMHWPLALLTCQNVPRSDILQAFAKTIHDVVRRLNAEGAWPGQLLLPRIEKAEQKAALPA